MSSPSIVAQRIWYAVAPDGAGHDLVIRVEAPFQEDGAWRAHVSLNALEPQAHVVAGLDSWQAVYMAMRFAAIRLGHFADKGWKFYWEKGGEQAAVDDLLIG